MRDALRSIGYFLTWGTIYGFVLGVWSTTMIFPGMGTIYGLIWGPVIGALCGLLCGLVAAVTQALTFHADIDLGAYRRRASLGFGLLTAIAAPLVLIATSHTILWANATTYQPSGREFLVPCLISAAFWGPLSAAYVAQIYPVWLARLKSGIQADASLPPIGWQVPNATADLIRIGTSWLTVGVGAALGIIVQLAHLRNAGVAPVSAWKTVEAALAGGIGAIILMVMLAIGSAAVAIFLRQLFFSEDAFSVSPQTQRRVMAVVTAVFTGIVCASPFKNYPQDSFLLIPIMALAAFYMYRAYPAFDHAYDKIKRKEKHTQNTLALDEGRETESVYNTEAEALHQTSLPQARQQKG